MILAMLWCAALAGFAMSSIYSLAVLLLFIAGFMDLSLQLRWRRRWCN